MTAVGDVLAVVITALVLTTVAFGLRIWVRGKILGAFGYDDLAMCVSYIGYVLFCSFTFASLHYGYGVPPTQPWHDPQKALKFFVITQPAYFLVSGSVKTTVALVLIRINGRRIIRNILLVAMVLVLIETTVVFFIVALQCHPLSVRWGETTGTCIDPNLLQRGVEAFSILDIVSNWLYSIMPIFMLRHTQLSRATKASVVVLLGIGMFSSIATIVRFIYVVKPIDLHHRPEDFNPSGLYLLLWSHVELFLAILATSLATLRPVLKQATRLVSRQRYTQSENHDEASGDLSRIGIQGWFQLTGISKKGVQADGNDHISETSIGKDHPGNMRLDVK